MAALMQVALHVLHPMDGHWRISGISHGEHRLLILCQRSIGRTEWTPINGFASRSTASKRMGF